MPFLVGLRVYAKNRLPRFAVRLLQMFWRTLVRPAARRARRLRAWLIETWWLGKNRLRGGYPLPPADLMFLVTGGRDLVWFLESGELAWKSIKAALVKNGIRPARLRSILDFGCGAGRVIRHLPRRPRTTLAGSDYNADLIAWCRRALPFARFEVNPFLGPLLFGDGEFDLVYALSVFTHLTEGQQGFWLADLRRVLRPGGLLLVSVHGAYHVRDYPLDARTRFDRGEMVVFAGEAAGTNVCTTFHPPAYMKSRFAPDFEFVDGIPEGALGNPRQDLYLFRKPGS
jgi:SAM-dependent methyltransferase